MSNVDDFDMDGQAAAREIKRRMSGLDPFIPAPPAYETIRPQSRLAGSDSANARVASRLRPNFGAPGALIAIAFVVVLVVASGNFRTAPTVGPSPSGSPSPSATAVPSPTHSIAPVPTQTPLATASLPPVVMFVGAVQNVAWSPGGTRIAITEGASGSAADVRIMTPDGRTVDIVKAVSFGWTGEDSYVAADSSGVFAGLVANSPRQVIAGDYVPWIPASTAGAVALELNMTASNQYVIWSAGALSAPRDGIPVEFSPDGTLLAVVHYPRGCCAGLPSPEPSKAPGPTTLDIVRTDTGKSVRSTGNVSWVYGLPISFSPDGHKVAFRRDRADGSDELGILDIATGKVWVVSSGSLDIVPQHSLAWLDTTHLDLRSSGPTGAAPAGLGIAITYWQPDVAARSVSSRRDVATARTGSTQIEIQTGGGQVTLDLPETFDAVQLLWSPDGSALIVVGMFNDSRVPGQVILFKL